MIAFVLVGIALCVGFLFHEHEPDFKPMTYFISLYLAALVTRVLVWLVTNGP